MPITREIDDPGGGDNPPLLESLVSQALQQIAKAQRDLAAAKRIVSSIPGTGCPPPRRGKKKTD